MSSGVTPTAQPPADLHVEDDDLANAEFAGRIDFLYRIGRFYLFLPFAALCVASTLFDHPTPQWLAIAPFLLQLGATVAGFQLVRRYENRDRSDDPQLWANRYVLLSGISGAIWGVGALTWFVPDSFPAQAYLTLAFLGMTATEFIARAAYRPAYLAHAALSLGPLSLLLFLNGEPYAMLACILVMFFGGVLYSYCGSFGDMLNESIRLRLINVRLVARLSREKEEAIAARDAAQASARAKASFIANISHEIRTPLNALLGMAQLLEQSELGHTQRNHVKVILEAGRGLKTLLDDVIALSRQDIAEIHMPELDCDTVYAARTVARLLQPRAWEKKLRLNVTAAADLPHAAGDPRRVRQILLKLTENALKFTDCGGVDIAVTAEADTRGGHYIRFCVADTGLGVPSELAHDLFTPFAAGDMTYTRRHQGAGLGLAVARQMVESMGGAIGFESAEGDGSTFWFTLPVARAAEAAISSPENALATAAPPAGLSVLAYLPDREVLSRVVRFLEPFGNRIVAASDVSEAVALAGRERFDVVVTDGANADSLGPAPSMKIPMLALVQPDGPAPVCANQVLRWPVGADALYDALRELTGNTPIDERSTDMPASAAIDGTAFAALEKSLGLATLLEILQAYIKTAEQLCAQLSAASQTGQWDDASRFAQDIAGAAGGLGLASLTQAAREFTQKTREGKNASELHDAAKSVVAEHARTFTALTSLYPDIAA